MNKCRYCEKEDIVEPCSECHPPEWDMSSGWDGVPVCIEKVYVRDYGYASVKRIEEVKRRVILPVTPNDGTSYYVGRRGENGKIQEREPNY